MGATSVTGVSGAGNVAGSQKGSEHMSLGVHKLIGPKVVACGVETLSGTTGVVEVPTLPGVVGDYVVMTQSNGSTASYVSSALAAVADTDTWHFTITAASSAVVSWVIVKKGL